VRGPGKLNEGRRSWMGMRGPGRPQLERESACRRATAVEGLLRR